jgi:hypothetical protein
MKKQIILEVMKDGYLGSPQFPYRIRSVDVSEFTASEISETIVHNTKPGQWCRIKCPGNDIPYPEEIRQGEIEKVMKTVSLKTD